jgi:hypothetical protein
VHPRILRGRSGTDQAIRSKIVGPVDPKHLGKLCAGAVHAALYGAYGDIADARRILVGEPVKPN